jgi:hypothetical protein
MSSGSSIVADHPTPGEGGSLIWTIRFYTMTESLNENYLPYKHYKHM